MAGNSVLAKMAVEISANTAKFGQGMDRVSSQFKSFTSGLTKLAGTIGLAFGVSEVAQFAFQVSKLAGEAEGVRAAFSKLPQSEKVMNDLKEATAGTVSELDLMKRTVQATNFGIALESLPDLLKFAAIRAQQTGQSVDYLVDSIVTGIGRKSPLILDNLGISAVRLKEQFGGAALEAQSIGDVAKAVGRIASEELVKMGDFSENTSTKVQRLSASWEDLKVAIGNAANESGVLAGSLDYLTQKMDDLAGKNIFNTLSNDLAGFISAGADSKINDTVEKLKELREESGKPLVFNANDLIELYKLSSDQADKLLGKINEINNALSIQEKAIGLVYEFAKKNGYTDLAKAADAYKTSLYQALVQEQIFQTKNKDNTDTLVLQSKTRIEELNKLIQAIAKYQTTLTPVAEGEKKLFQTYDDLKDKLGELNSQFESATDANDRKKLANIGAEIVATKQLIAELDKLRAAREAVAKPNEAAILGGLGAKPLKTQFTTTNVNEGIKTVVPLSNDEMTKRIFDNLKKLKLVNTDVTETVKGQWIDLSGVISGAISDIAFSFGQAAAGVGNFGDAILKAMINFAKQFGEILIATGTAALAAKALAKHPVTAIAAGVALVAIAGAASAAIGRAQSNYNTGSTSGGSSSGFRDTARASGSVQDSNPVATVILRGEDIYVSLQNFIRNNKATKTALG